MSVVYSTFLLIGIFSGFLSGLFGVGGGVILVPSLLITFTYFNFPAETLMHLVLGTSLSCIIITCLNSSYAHLRKVKLDKTVFFNITAGIILGASSGGYIVTYLSTFQLQVFFVLFLLLVTFKMFVGFSVHTNKKIIPRPYYWIVGYLIGMKSTLLGVGGGTLSVPFLNWTGKKMHEAVAISATIGIPIAVIGTISYMISGFNVQGLPQYSLGYVYLPGFIGISITSTFSARFGANLSHKISHEKLRNIFKYFLLVILLKSIFNLFN
jgi:uncharacterized protein